MRKLTALVILTVVFFPLAFAAMTMTSIRPWVLDRGFYERLVNDERLYEPMLTDAFSSRLEQGIFTPEEQIPLDVLSIALREVVTADYLRTQSLNVIDGVFDYIEGRETTFEARLDIAPIKAALRGEGRARFAVALAAALPACAAGQQPIAPDGNLTRCIADNDSVDVAAEQIAAALPAVLESTPDYIALNDATPYIRMNWYDFDWLPGRSVIAGLDIAMLMTIFTAVAAGFAGAYLGGDDLRARLKWFSASLFAPASLFVFMGLALAAPWTASSISDVLASGRWNGVAYSDAYREAVSQVIVPVIQQLGSGFLLTGIVACLIAAVVLVASWVTPNRAEQPGKMVRVPVRNP